MGLQVRRRKLGRKLSLISPQILKNVDFIGGSFQDCHGKEDKEDRVVGTQVATSTILSVRPLARSSPDGELTPLFSPTPSTLDPNALRRKGHSVK